MGSHRVTCHPAEAEFPALTLAVTGRQLIYLPINDERLSRPGQCETRATVNIPAIGHHCSLTGTKTHWLVVESHVCEQLARGHYMTAD